MRTHLRNLILVTAPLTLAVSACGSDEPSMPDGDETMAPMDDVAMAPAAIASAELKRGDGSDAGTASITSTGDGLMVSINVVGLTPGDHGAHVHMTGSCEAPDFKSAGGHWNPEHMKHGLENPEGQHAGDMPNLVVAEDGSGSLEYELKGGTASGLLDTDGAALVIHAGPDDQRTDPSGDSGARVACGVFSATDAPAAE